MLLHLIHCLTPSALTDEVAGCVLNRSSLVPQLTVYILTSARKPYYGSGQHAHINEHVVPSHNFHHLPVWFLRASAIPSPISVICPTSFSLLVSIPAIF